MEHKQVVFDLETQMQYLSGDSFLQDHVYIQYKSLIHSVCLRYKRKFESLVDYDELVSIGNEAFVRAAITFDPTKNVQFSTYLTNAVNKAILHYMRDAFGFYGGSLYRLDYFKTVRSLDQTVRVGDEEFILGDLLAGSDESLSYIEMSQTIEAFLLQYLKKKDARFKRMLHMIISDSEYTQKQIADAIGTDQAHVSMMLKRMKQAFYKELDRDQPNDSFLTQKIA